MSQPARFDMIVHAVVSVLFLVTVILLAWFDRLDAPTVSAVGIGSFGLLTGSDAIVSWRGRTTGSE